MRLSVQLEFDKTLDLETENNKVIVGRGPECDLVLTHNTISREHCEIEIINGQYYVTDLGSSNGTSINGKKLEAHKKTIFTPMQHLRIGGLESDISDRPLKKEEYKILSTGSSKDGKYVTTLRIGRIELNKPSQTLELEKQLDRSGPRNPVTAEIQEELPQEKKIGNLGFIIFLLIIGFILYSLFSDKPSPLFNFLQKIYIRL